MTDTETSPTNSPRISRRRLLRGGATVGAAALGTSVLGGPSAWAVSPTNRGPVREPFTLGVASGDPMPDGVVLWTRLCPEPLGSGLFGMPNRPVPVKWQVATDEHFRHVVARGTELARPESAHSVHAEVSGLRPGADYFYRFKTGPELSPLGRTRTALTPGARLDKFAFAFTSCHNLQHGYFTALRHMADEDLDLVVQLGDYIYETGWIGWLYPGIPRDIEGEYIEAITLDQYRRHHAQYKRDPDLQAAHAAFPWVVVLDDHELQNNWAGQEWPQEDAWGRPQDPRARRRAAFQAYYENMPLRRSSMPRELEIPLYRRLVFGDLVDLHVLDTRQYRSGQVPDAQRDDPARTILGDVQEDWLHDAVAGPTARWNVLAQQVFFSQRDLVGGPGTDFSNDAWDNYVVERNRLRDHLAHVGTSNPMVITGDVHANYVCDVKADFNDPGSPTVATELVGTSVSSGRDGQDQGPGDAVQLAENPHVRFLNRNRGYVRNTITPNEWSTDFRIVDYVTRRGAGVRTRATFVVEEGRPGAQPA